jgi:hypothetical protein
VVDTVVLLRCARDILPHRAEQLLRFPLARNLVARPPELSLLVSQDLAVPMQQVRRLAAAVRRLLHLVVDRGEALCGQRAVRA